MEEKNPILRGQIYHINIDANHKPVGSEMWPDRPAIIVSNDINNQYSNTVEVVYLTTKLKRKFSPTHVKVRPRNRPSLAMCEQIHSVSKDRLGAYIDTLSESDLALIDAALMCSLGITTASQHVANLFHKWELYINKYHLDVGMQLTQLFDAEQTTPETINSGLVKTLQQDIDLLTKEADAYKRLLALAEQERDQYKQLYEQVKNK